MYCSEVALLEVAFADTSSSRRLVSVNTLSVVDGGQPYDRHNKGFHCSNTNGSSGIRVRCNVFT